MKNQHLDAAKHGIQAVNILADSGMPLNFDQQMQRTTIDAALGAARELQRANQLAEQAAERQAAGNLIAYASLLHQVTGQLPEGLMDLVQEAALHNRPRTDRSAA